MRWAISSNKPRQRCTYGLKYRPPSRCACPIAKSTSSSSFTFFRLARLKPAAISSAVAGLLMMWSISRTEWARAHTKHAKTRQVIYTKTVMEAARAHDSPFGDLFRRHCRLSSRHLNRYIRSCRIFL